MTTRHPSSEAFHTLLRAAGEMHDRKQADYGTDADPFANVRAAADWGLPGSLGACIRMGDKLHRLQSYYRKGTLTNESVVDTFLDGLVYNGIGLLLYIEENGLSLDDVLAELLPAREEPTETTGFLAASLEPYEQSERADLCPQHGVTTGLQCDDCAHSDQLVCHVRMNAQGDICGEVLVPRIGLRP